MEEEISLTMVESALREISAAKDVERKDDVVVFKYKDKDGDEVAAVVQVESEERLFCTLLLRIPEEVFVTSMICSNMYNMRKDAHGTFAYATKSENDCYITLEAHLLSRGGTSATALKHFFRNFIECVDRFEGVLIPAIRELGPDSSFLKAGGWSTFWSAVGAFWRGYSQT